MKGTTGAHSHDEGEEMLLLGLFIRQQRNGWMFGDVSVTLVTRTCERGENVCNLNATIIMEWLRLRLRLRRWFKEALPAEESWAGGLPERFEGRAESVAKSDALKTRNKFSKLIPWNDPGYFYPYGIQFCGEYCLVLCENCFAAHVEMVIWIK